MRLLKISGICVFLLLVFSIAALADNGGRIYGKLTTVDGDTFEGMIRWDKNEASWCDVLDGTKELPDRDRKSKRKKYRDRESSIELFGITIAKGGSSWNWSGSAQSGIRFGHIKSLEVIDDDAVLLVLKSGEEVELENGSTDIGGSIRDIVIEDESEGEIGLVWDDLERIDFMATPSGKESNFGDRLYGTLTSRRGDEFTGWVCWDIDEVFTADILDGEQKRRDRKIKFGKIKAIERYSSNGATLTLTNGDEVVLRESNDVDDSNRGIVISDLAFGQVIVDWDEFDRLEFKEDPGTLRYDRFDGGRALHGTVYTEDGESYEGKVRWDDDEEFSWEILDGEYHDIQFDIEFGLIKEIQKKSYRSAVVTVSDGRSFRLRGSNDVDEDNKGIYVTLNDGEEVEIDWEEFDRIEFAGH